MSNTYSVHCDEHGRYSVAGPASVIEVTNRKEATRLTEHFNSVHDFAYQAGVAAERKANNNWHQIADERSAALVAERQTLAALEGVSIQQAEALTTERERQCQCGHRQMFHTTDLGEKGDGCNICECDEYKPMTNTPTPAAVRAAERITSQIPRGGLGRDSIAAIIAAEYAEWMKAAMEQASIQPWFCNACDNAGFVLLGYDEDAYSGICKIREAHRLANGRISCHSDPRCIAIPTDKLRAELKRVRITEVRESK